jgi:phage shock protein A
MKIPVKHPIAVIHVLVSLSLLALAACQGQGGRATGDAESRISDALNEMQAEFSEGMDTLSRHVTELRGEAQRAIENGDTTLAGQYRDTAARLEEAKNRLSARWDVLRSSASQSWDQVQNELEEFRSQLNSVVDSLGTHRPG